MEWLLMDKTNKSTSISSIDNMGRVFIPEKIRENMNLNYKDTVEFTIDNNNIQLKKIENKCIFCGSSKELFEFMDKKICKNCFKDIDY